MLSIKIKKSLFCMMILIFSPNVLGNELTLLAHSHGSNAYNKASQNSASFQWPTYQKNTEQNNISDTNLNKSEENTQHFLFPENVHITGKTLDEIILQGIKNIKENGARFDARAGSGLQAYDVSYTLLNPQERIHWLRIPRSTQYFCRELLAYFKGSLDVSEGLSQASKIWQSLADKNNQVSSNYGYYVFHQRIPECGNLTQYEWVLKNLEKNLDSRKAFININQPHHKNFDSKDFPCTLGMQFFVRNNHLCCVVSSRSTDIFTGLPYDMGFFSFVTELVYKNLKERLDYPKKEQLNLGYVTMKTNFTQIYDKTSKQALGLLNTLEKQDKNLYIEPMPSINDAQETLNDIYNETQKTPVMKWIHKHANFC
ncbi:MAG: thymidylate synthase [Candidatus Babeliales bacterium]